MQFFKYIIPVYIIFFIFSLNPVYAQSPTSKQALDEKLNNQINNLKDKIASRVTELDLVEKRGITGEVVEASTSQITLKDIHGNTRLIDIDEITKFSSSSSSDNFGVSDLKKGLKLNIVGLYNKESKRLLARFVSTAVNPIFLSGRISALDENDFQFDLLTNNNKTTKIDVVSSTKTNTYDKDNNATKSGFSKLNISDRIIVIGLPDKNDSNVIIANRVLIFSALPKNPNLNITEPIPSPTESP